MPIRSQMSLIMEQIEPELPELFVLEFGKIAESDFSTKRSQNVCDHKISDEIDYGFNRTRTI